MSPIVFGGPSHRHSYLIVALLARPAACGPVFIEDRMPDFEQQMIDLRKMESRLTISCLKEATWYDDDLSDQPLKARRRRFQAFVASLRPPEPEFLPPAFVKPGKRAVRRWGARAREQRERRKA